MSWQIGISTGMFNQVSLEELLREIKQAGFQAIELDSLPQHFDYHMPERAKEVKNQIESLGLTIYSLHAPYGPEIDLSLPSEKARLKAVAEVKAAAEALALLGGKTLVVHPGGERNKEELPLRLRKAGESLREIHLHCRGSGLTLAVEGLLPHLLGGDTAELAWLLSQLALDGAGLCLDTSHAALGNNLWEWLTGFSSRLIMLHAHDSLGLYDDHLPPGEGKIDWQRVKLTLNSIAFQGMIILEVRQTGELKESLRRAKESSLLLVD